MSSEVESEPSLYDKLDTAIDLAWRLTYKNMRKDGTYHEVREVDPDVCDIVAAHADGLVQRYAFDRRDGRCSLQAMIDFDVEEFEKSVDSDIEKMREALEKVGEPVVCTDEYLIAGGWKV